MMSSLSRIQHDADLCVIGAGLAGMGTAIAAARHGLKVLLMHDRPMPGGNSSSEIRMWVCGCKGLLETGLIEEIRLDNLARNPEGNFSIWDLILYEKVKYQDNLTVLFNCSCMDAATDEDTGSILSVTGWQTTTQQFHDVKAKLFADCSGDSILAPLCKANFRVGRDARQEFSESLAQENADRRTMGMSCLLQARENQHPVKFIPPKWAETFPEEGILEYRDHFIDKAQNFWWVELGGEQDSIADTENTRDLLLPVLLGIWDHIKNGGEHDAGNWSLDWLGFLPGKRESRRYVGDVTVTQNDILSATPWQDAIAYGGWPVDDHHPGGIRYSGEPNTNIIPRKPYTLPLRALCSNNVPNLLFAGRNISVTHVALSSTRVMATCMQLGEAAGILAAVALSKKRSLIATARENYSDVQSILLENDVTIPGLMRSSPQCVMQARLFSNQPNAERLRSGKARPQNEDELQKDCWHGKKGDFITCEFQEKRPLGEVRIVLESDLLSRGKDNRHLNVIAQRFLEQQYSLATPESIMKDIDIIGDDGKLICKIRDNHQRFLRISLPEGTACKTVTLKPLEDVAKAILLFEVNQRLPE